MMTTESELDEARRELLDLDLVLPAACGSRVDAVQQLKAERGEARAQLAALVVPASEMLAWAERNHVLLVHRDFHGRLAAALADLAAAAAEHDARVRAPVEAERDQLAAALAAVWKEADGALHALTMALIAHDGRVVTAVDSDGTGRLHVVFRSLHAFLGNARMPLPAVLAAQREARIRADERAKALREASYEIGSHGLRVAADMLRAMADEAERGTQ